MNLPLGGNATQTQLAHKEVKLRYLAGQIEECNRECCQLKEVVIVLKETIQEHTSTVSALHYDLNSQKLETKQLNALIEVQRQEIAQLNKSEESMYSIKHSAYYQWL